MTFLDRRHSRSVVKHRVKTNTYHKGNYCYADLGICTFMYVGNDGYNQRHFKTVWAIGQ
jgi:hypothetical protein